MTDWTQIRERLSRDIQVFYVKNVEINTKREKDKEKTIDWMMVNLKLGPVKGGVLKSSDPEFTWTFGDSFIWNAERRAILTRDPICKLCGNSPATEVHHIRPKHLNGAPYHPRNLIGLCTKCHDEVHRKIDEGIRAVVEDSLDIVPMSEDQTSLSKYGVISDD